MSEEITKIINQLCEKLGVAANILIPELAKYNIARLTFQTVVQTALLVVLVAIVVKITKCLMACDDEFYYKALAALSINLIPGIVIVVLVISTISSATNLIGWIVSPTASAVKEITSMIK